MKLFGEELRRALGEAALDLDELELCNDFGPDEIFAVRLPDEAEPWFVSVPAEDDLGSGLLITRGKSGYRDMMDLAYNRDDGGDLIDQVSMISLNVDDLEEGPPGFEIFIPDEADDDDDFVLVPFLLVKEPGRVPTPVGDADAARCLMLFRGTIAAQARGLLDQVETAEPGGPMVTLMMSGDPEAPNLSVETVLYQVPPRLVSTYLPPDLAELKKLKKIGKTWYVGYWYLPESDDPDGRSLHCLAVLQDKKPINRVIVPGRDLNEAARLLFETMTGTNNVGAKVRPKKIVFSGESLFETVAPALRELGVTCVLDPDNQVLAAGHEKAVIGLQRERMLKEFEMMVADPTPRAVPSRDDLEAWKKANMQITARIGREIMALNASPEKALKQYFGDLEAAEYHLFETDDNEEFGLAMMGFGEWFCFHYRPGKKDQTAAEKMLETDLPAAQRLALEARLQAEVSIYTIEQTDPQGNLVLSDVLFGRTVTVHDQLLAESAEPGIVLPLRVFALGDFHFCLLIGPALAPYQSAAAAAFLIEKGIGDDPAQVRDRAHLFGRLWDLVENELDDQDGPPVNRDGETMSVETARYRLERADQTKKALLQRPDVEYDRETEEYIWVQKSLDLHSPHERLTILGVIWIEGEELNIEVNSRPRLDRARQWLDRVPGVRFLDQQSRPMEDYDDLDEDDDDYNDDAELDPAVPGPVPLTKSSLKEMQRVLDEYYMRWLDLPIPAFGDKTPRQMAQTKDGKRKVAVMIRTLTPPAGVSGITVPRERMLRELGLDQE